MGNQFDIVLFDGVCNLCNGAINFVIDNDPKGKFKFASLQSEEGQELLRQHGLNQQFIDSLVLIKNDKAYIKSSGALHIAKGMGGFWKMAFIFMIVPKFIRDWVYDLIARNRYKWFGKRDACRMPSQELKDRFLQIDKIG